MQTIRELKQRGFTVQASNASGCTEVRFDAKFHFFNPKFLDGALHLVDSLKNSAKLNADQHCIIVAGTFADADEFPLVLLDMAQVAEIKEAHAQHAAATQKAMETGAVLTSLFQKVME